MIRSVRGIGTNLLKNGRITRAVISAFHLQNAILDDTLYSSTKFGTSWILHFRARKCKIQDVPVENSVHVYYFIFASLNFLLF